MDLARRSRARIGERLKMVGPELPFELPDRDAQRGLPCAPPRGATEPSSLGQTSGRYGIGLTRDPIGVADRGIQPKLAVSGSDQPQGVVIVEYIRYRTSPDDQERLKAAYRDAAASLDASEHCLAHELSHGVEECSQNIPRMEWYSVDGHEQGFGRRPGLPLLDRRHVFARVHEPEAAQVVRRVARLVPGSVQRPASSPGFDEIRRASGARARVPGSSEQ